MNLSNRRNDICSKVLKMLAEKLKMEKEKISVESSLKNDLGVDSVETLEIVSIFEEEFKIKIPEEFVVKIETVNDIVELIQERESVPDD